jgi:5-(hydroxymethyl)furfural/furfural oxidase
MRQLNQKNKKNYLITSLFANLLDLAPFATKIICSRLSADKVDFQKLVDDSALLKEFALKNVGGLAHNVGTCRMGVQADQNAVVDEAGKVFGIQGLRIADASIMPTVPSGNTFLSTIMLAEKIADAIKSND